MSSETETEKNSRVGRKKASSVEGMERRLGMPAVFAVSAGAMFSSGFFLLPGMAADETGPILPVAYLVASMLMLPAIFCISELSSAMPRAGGPYLFITRSFGPQIGILGALGIYMVLLLKGAFAFVGVGFYLALVVDVSIVPVALALIAGFTLLNLLGVKQTAGIEIALVAILLLLLGYFLVAGTTDMVREGTAVLNSFDPLLPFGWEGLIAGIALVYISYGGIGQVASLAEEVKKPARSIPYGMLIALGVTTLFYFLGTTIMVVLIDPDMLRDDVTPVATAAEQLVTFPLPIWVIVMAALAAFASTGNAAILSAARYPLAMARDKLLWSRFGNVSDKGIPRFSVIITGIALALVVLALDVENIAKVGSAFLLFVFLFLCLAVIIFRESRIDEYQPGYRSPLYPWMQIAGLLIYAWLIIVSGLEAVVFILGICLLGTLWYWFGVGERRKLSGPVYYLFGRLARQNPQYQSSVNIGILPLPGPRITELVEHAIFIELEEDADFDRAAEEAAGALRDRLGGDRKEIAHHLHREARRWLRQIESELVVSPVLLQEIEHPEMVIIRGKIRLESKSYLGLIVLADDERKSGRLLRLLSQLEQAITQSAFRTAWKEVERPEELKKALELGVQTFTLRVEKSGPTASLHGTAIRDADLPDGSILILVQRNGHSIVPDGSTELRAGDEVIIVAEGEAIKKLNRRFKESILT